MIPLRLPQLRADQYQVISHPAKRRCLVAGRRWGKTYCAGAMGTGAAYGGLPVALVAPEYGNLDPLWEFALEAVMPLKAKGYVRISNVDRSIEFLFNGGKLELFSALNHTAALGRAFSIIIFDEAALIPERVINGTFIPMLADYNGDALAISTPTGFNWFHDWYQLGQSGDPYYKSWRHPTLDNPNPNIQALYWHEKKTSSALNFLQQYDAEFVADGNGVFINIDACATAKKQERAIEGHSYCAGLDVGRLKDFTAMVVYDQTTKEAVHLLRISDLDFSRQFTHIADVYNRFLPKTILVEQNSIGLPLLDDLRRGGMPVQGWLTTQSTKAQLVDALALAFQNKTLKIIPDETLINELKTFVGTRTNNGLWRYAAAGSGHDDTVISLGLAYHAGNVPAKITRIMENPFFN